MKYRSISSQSDLFTILEHHRKADQSRRGILRIKQSIDWEQFRPLLGDILGYSGRDAS